jgi:hypothetical protein
MRSSHRMNERPAVDGDLLFFGTRRQRTHVKTIFILSCVMQGFIVVYRLPDI